MNKQAFAYPVTLSHEDDVVIAEFLDVPEAHTQGTNKADALFQATDCLVAALSIYVERRIDIPKPSPVRGRPVVALPPLVATKVALYQAMREAKMTNVALAERLGVTENVVRRLLDLDHRSHIGQVEAGLAVLGKRVVVEVRDAA